MAKAQEHDETIQLLLSCGNEAEIREGFTLIDKHLRDPICGWLRANYYPGVSADDLADLWQETLAELLKQVRSGKYTGERKVFTDLCRIISTNAIDQRRRHKSRDKLVQAVGEALRETQTGQKWKDADPVARREVKRLIREAAATLPEKQRQVLEAFVANFPESRDMHELRRFTSELTGKEETVASVKGNLREARQKLRGILRRKGYGPNKSGDDDE
jgi:DNA-directed RNA polymerase specialized sigma24 family protein